MLAPGRSRGRLPVSSLTALSSEPDGRRQLTRAVIASTVGTTIEWYDFFLYSTVTGLVFAQLYFPKSNAALGTLQAFGIYAVGFAARPVGAAIFGHYGDRIGRKSTLIATLLLMGVATFLVAFVPTYGQIGICGAVLLPILRFIQGARVGGARMDLCSGSPGHDSAGYDVRAAGRADRRILPRTVALQRGVNGLSGGSCNCRWAGPVY